MKTDSEREEQAEEAVLLFSYGTLRQPEVQRATYGRLLEGRSDVLVGYRLAPLAISDPEVVRISGKAVHTIARFSGEPGDRTSSYTLNPNMV